MLSVWVWLAAPAQAEIKPSGLFNDNCVLQRDMEIPVFGTGTDGEKVSVTLDQDKAEATVKDGKWLAKLKPLKAGGPYTLTIAGNKDKVECKNVLVGDVWVCGGQSNMEMGMGGTANAKAAIEASANDKIRLITIPRHGKPSPQDDVSAKWEVCGPQTVGGFTAVGYYFGRALQKDLNVPIGLINSNVGGTPAERWTPKEALAAEPALDVYAKNANSSDLYNAMIHPLIRYAVKGAIWYQGESNAGQAYRYRTLFPTMIKSWRTAWNEGELPFFFVQLAPFMKIEDHPTDSNWAELREAQLLTLKNVPKTGMAVITDVGDEKDIHPKQKQPVGERLAQAARAVAYGEKVEPSGPIYASMVVSGPEVTLKFDHVGQGLMMKGDKLTGFTIAGEDKKFVNADAKIVGDTVVVSSPEVPKPASVRFGWANYPVVNLWNKDGLPASPFRTDTWPATTDKN
jgi:sialate O-acetylesterase